MGGGEECEVREGGKAKWQLHVPTGASVVAVGGGRPSLTRTGSNAGFPFRCLFLPPVLLFLARRNQSIRKFGVVNFTWQLMVN